MASAQQQKQHNARSSLKSYSIYIIWILFIELERARFLFFLSYQQLSVALGHRILIVLLHPIDTEIKNCVCTVLVHEFEWLNSSQVKSAMEDNQWRRSAKLKYFKQLSSCLNENTRETLIICSKSAYEQLNSSAISPLEQSPKPKQTKNYYANGTST